MALCVVAVVGFFFFNDTATTEIYTLSLHDALPILIAVAGYLFVVAMIRFLILEPGEPVLRSEEHTSELQSQSNLVCRLLLEKKKKLTQTACTANIKHHSITHLKRYTQQPISCHNTF